MKTPAFDDLGDKTKQNPTNRRIGYLYQKGFYKIGQDQPTGNLPFSSGRKNLRLYAGHCWLAVTRRKSNRIVAQQKAFSVASLEQV
jgi:hypothetical protein